MKKTNIDSYRLHVKHKHGPISEFGNAIVRSARKMTRRKRFVIPFYLLILLIVCFFAVQAGQVLFLMFYDPPFPYN